MILKSPYSKFAVAALLLLILVPTNQRARHNRRHGTGFRGRELTCAVTLGSGLKESYQFGLSYELLTSFADSYGCPVRIKTITDSTHFADFADSLREGSYDIVVIREGVDSGDFSGLRASLNFDGTHTWLLKDGLDRDLKEVNMFLATMSKTSSEYASLVKLFSGAYNPFKRAQSGFRSKVLSPYDGIIKKYAKEIGWDWRMFAAIVYAESKFTINNVSSRGAIGLMQVMPRTGAKYGATNLMDPEQNIMVGAQFLRRLQNQFPASDFGYDERVNFTLAAYNAGEGRIAYCREYAATKGKDSSNWASVSSLFPIEGFNGRETIAYVKSVRSVYSAFCTICPN